MLNDCERTSTKTIVNFIEETNWNRLPKEVVRHTRRVILDTIGCALAGSQTDIGRIMVDLVRELGGVPESSLLGTAEKTSCVNAALANAKNANALDYDDTFRNIIHLASDCVIPALSMGERIGATGKDLILSVALGYDLVARLLLGGGSDSTFRKGASAHALVQVFGGIAAASKILGLDEDEIMNAFGIAGAAAQLNNQRYNRLPWKFVKYSEPGFTSHTAILACLLAQKGDTGNADIFDYDDGFWTLMSVPKFDSDLFVKDLGKHWYILENQFKYYPCCHHIQNPAELTEKLVKRHKLKKDEISEVRVKGVPFLLDEVLASVQPADGITAQFSTAHVIAMVVFGVEPGPEWQDPKRLNDPEVSAFRKKVKVELLPSSLESFTSKEHDFGWKKLPAQVEIAARGKKFRDQQDFTKGDNWVSTEKTDELLMAKFRRNASYVFPLSRLWGEKVEDTIKAIFKLEKMKNINDLTGILVY